MTDLRRVVARRDQANKLWGYKFERAPIVVYGGDESRVLKEKGLFPLDGDRRIVGFWTFHGLDRGDIVEMDTDIGSPAGFPLFLRGPHKENVAAFDAWQWYAMPYTFVAGELWMSIICRVNGENRTLDDHAIKVHRNGDRLTARPHWGIWVICRDI